MHSGWIWNIGKVFLNFKLVSENSLFHSISAPASQEYIRVTLAQIVQPSFLLSLLYHVAGNFRMVQIFVYFVASWWLQKKNRENFYERTLEPEDGPPSLFQVLCESPPCTSFAAWQTFDAPWVSTNSKRIQGYQAYRESWATVLVKKCLAWRKLATGSIFHWCEDSTAKCDTQRHGQLPRPAYAQIKTAKISFERIQHFREILHQWKFPVIQYFARKSGCWTETR